MNTFWKPGQKAFKMDGPGEYVMRRGHVVNITSMAGAMPPPRWYSPSYSGGWSTAGHYTSRSGHRLSALDIVARCDPATRVHDEIVVELPRSGCSNLERINAAIAASEKVAAELKRLRHDLCKPRPRNEQFSDELPVRASTCASKEAFTVSGLGLYRTATGSIIDLARNEALYDGSMSLKKSKWRGRLLRNMPLQGWWSDAGEYFNSEGRRCSRLDLVERIS